MKQIQEVLMKMYSSIRADGRQLKGQSLIFHHADIFGNQYWLKRINKNEFKTTFRKHRNH